MQITLPDDTTIELEALTDALPFTEIKRIAALLGLQGKAKKKIELLYLIRVALDARINNVADNVSSDKIDLQVLAEQIRQIHARVVPQEITPTPRYLQYLCDPTSRALIKSLSRSIDRRQDVFIQVDDTIKELGVMLGGLKKCAIVSFWGEPEYIRNTVNFLNTVLVTERYLPLILRTNQRFLESRTM
jgi:hypothetical protein